MYSEDEEDDPNPEELLNHSLMKSYKIKRSLLRLPILSDIYSNDG